IRESLHVFLMGRLFLSPMSLFLKNIFSNIKDEYVYGISLDTSTGIDSHGVDIRKIPATNNIEFFDSNFGLFLFKIETTFINWFTMLMHAYRMEGANFKTGELECMGKQPSNAKSCLPSFDRPITRNITNESIREVVNEFNEFYKKNAEQKFKKLSKDEIND